MIGLMFFNDVLSILYDLNVTWFPVVRFNYRIIVVSGYEDVLDSGFYFLAV